MTSADELGLAGARTWARDSESAIVLNCDGVDDNGALVIMHGSDAPSAVIEALRSTSRVPVRVRRMPLGLLTDSVAFADRGWPAVTVSHGSFATLARIHTSRDTLHALRGTNVDAVAATLARAAEALAQ